MADEEEEEVQDGSNSKSKQLMVYQSGTSFGSNIANPFIAYYAARLNATAVQLGWLNALTNLIPNAFQYPWAKMSDRVGRRVPFIVFGAIMVATAFVLLTRALDPTTVILVVVLQAMGLAIIAPAWSALLGDTVSEKRRGRFFSRLLVTARTFGLAGMLCAGIFVLFAPPTSSDIFHIGFLIAAGAFAVSMIALLFIKENRVDMQRPAVENCTPEERWRSFRYFIAAQAVFVLFMSMIWPLIPITIVDVLGASNLDIVIFSVSGVLTAIAFQYTVGRFIDRAGPVSFIIASRFMLVFVPMVYAFAPNMYVLFILNAFVGIVDAMISIALIAYVLDLAPSDKRAEFFAIYSTLIGVCTFFGSLMGGYLAGYLKTFLAVPVALMVVYSVSTAGRMAGAIMHLRIRDPRTYPQKISLYEYIRFQVVERLHLKRH